MEEEGGGMGMGMVGTLKRRLQVGVAPSPSIPKNKYINKTPMSMSENRDKCSLTIPSPMGRFTGPLKTGMVHGRASRVKSRRADGGRLVAGVDVLFAGAVIGRCRVIHLSLSPSNNF